MDGRTRSFMAWVTGSIIYVALLHVEGIGVTLAPLVAGVVVGLLAGSPSSGAGLGFLVGLTGYGLVLGMGGGLEALHLIAGIGGPMVLMIVLAYHALAPASVSYLAASIGSSRRG